MTDNAGSIGVDVVPDARGFDEKLRAQIRDITATVRAKVDDELAKADLDALARDRGLKLVPKVDDPAAAKARTEMARLRVLARDAGMKIEPKVSEADRAKTQLELEALAHSRNVELTPKVDKSAAAGARSELSLLTTGVLTLGPALIPIAAATGGLAAALGAPLTAAGAGVTLFGFLAGHEIKATDKVAKQIDALKQKANTLVDPKARAAAAQQAAALEKSLNGPQREFLRLRAQLKTTFNQVASNKAIFEPVNSGLRLLNTVLPKTRPLLNAVSHSLGAVVNDLDKWGRSKSFDRLIGGMARLAGPTIKIGAQSLGDIGKGLIGLGRALGPLGIDALTGIEHLTAGFATFGQGSSTNAGVQAFIAYVRDEGPKVAHTLGDVAVAAVHVATALAPVGGVVLHGIDLLARIISSMPTGELTVLATGIISVRLALQGISLYTKAGGALDSLGGTLGKVSGQAEGISRTQTAIRGLAGAGGLGLLVDGSQRANKSVGALEMTLGGAAAGFAVGGPVGAGLGTGIGLFIGLKNAISGTNDVKMPTLKQLGLSDIITGLDEANTKATQFTRNTLFDFLKGKTKGTPPLGLAVGTTIRDTAHLYGIPDKQLVDAMTGNVTQFERIKARLRAAIKKDPNGIAASDWATLIGSIRNANKEYRAQQLAIREDISANGDYQELLKGFPKSLITKIETKGLPVTEAGVVRLARKMHLTPKQIQTVIDATHVPTTLAKVQSIINKGNEWKRLHPTTSVDANTDPARRKLDGVLSYLRSIITTPWNIPVTISSSGSVPKPKHRAMGGPVTKDHPYIVGDRGPRSAWELFVPKTSGRIVPHVPTTSSGTLHGTRLRLVVGGREFDAHLEQIADSRVESALSMQGQSERAFG